MKRVKLTENDLTRIVKKVISESPWDTSGGGYVHGYQGDAISDMERAISKLRSRTASSQAAYQEQNYEKISKNLEVSRTLIMELLFLVEELKKQK